MDADTPTLLEAPSKIRRPSLGRPRKERGLDLFDTPPEALDPLFAHEPLLRNATEAAEPFAGLGNLVRGMQQRGLIVHASDIASRFPSCTALDFLKMTARPCDLLLSNCAYDGIAGSAMEFLEHAWALGFRLVVLLLKVSFLCTEERFERMHPRGHLRRVYVLAERLQGMHDAQHLANGGKKAAPAGVHGWFVFDRDYYGPPTIIPVSIYRPNVCMPWAAGARQCAECSEPYQARRAVSRFCGDACRQRAHRRSRDLAVTTPSRDIAVTAAALKLTQHIGTTPRAAAPRP